MDPKLIALIACTLLVLCVAVVRSDRALARGERQQRRNQFDNHGHE